MWNGHHSWVEHNKSCSRTPAAGPRPHEDRSRDREVELKRRASPSRRSRSRDRDECGGGKARGRSNPVGGRDKGSSSRYDNHPWEPQGDSRGAASHPPRDNDEGKSSRYDDSSWNPKGDSRGAGSDPTREGRQDRRSPPRKQTNGGGLKLSSSAARKSAEAATPKAPPPAQPDQPRPTLGDDPPAPIAAEGSAVAQSLDDSPAVDKACGTSSSALPPDAATAPVTPASGSNPTLATPPTAEGTGGNALSAVPPGHEPTPAGDDAPSMTGSLSESHKARTRSPGDERHTKHQRRDSGSAFGDESIPETSSKVPVTIIYTRRRILGKMSDFGVQLQDTDCVWSTVVNAPGNERILNNSSFDQVVIKRVNDCTGQVLTAPEADPLVQRGMQRATDDMSACQRHLHTTDPVKCISALWVAWNRQGASAEHVNSSPTDWVQKYIPINNETLLVEETYANAHASLETRVRGPSLMTGGPQLHWSGDSYSEDQERVRKQDLAAWKGRVAARQLIVDKTNGV